MSNLIELYKNETNTVFIINDTEQGLVSVPNNLKNNIKVFMIFKDNIAQDHDRNKLMIDMQVISQKINANNDSGILIVCLVGNDFLRNENVVNYGGKLNEIKNLVNNIYNRLLRDGKLEKENVVKNIEVLPLDGSYDEFTNWLCSQNPSKFRIANSKELFQSNKTDKQNGVFIDNKVNIFTISPNVASEMNPNNVTPINAGLSIGTPRFDPNFGDGTSSGGGPVNSGDLGVSNNKIKSLKPPRGNAAFIKWYTTLFILLLSLIIGISISVVLIG